MCYFRHKKQDIHIKYPWDRYRIDGPWKFNLLNPWAEVFFSDNQMIN